jgi:PadR family transcriptional regulator, regulatory protein PadR
MVDGGTQSERVESLVLELRRGALVLAVLSRLDQEEYGYSLKRSLAEAGLEIDEGTLYPLLRRLEGQGLLTSEWLIAEGRPRRYYRISAEGVKTRRALSQEWNALAKVMKGLLP